MKKTLLLLTTIIILSSCLNTDDLPNYKYEFVAIDEATTPANFRFGKRDTITLKYTLPNTCYNFDNIYYDNQDTARVVAIRTYIDLDKNCAEVITQKEYKLIINVGQQEDYLFKFFKGKDSNGENIFEEVVIPVN